MPKIAMPKIQ